MSLTGKGFFIWKINNCESGSTSAIVDQAVASGLTHVLIKIADGISSSNVDLTTGADKVAPLAVALKAKGIQVWGWHFVYGTNPTGEANKAISRLQALNLDGYVVDAESAYKTSGATAATTFMKKVRASYPNLPIALSSYRYPSYHRDFPWNAFQTYCNYNMPQVYFEQAHNPATQLTKSVTEFKNMTPSLPVIPTGPTYKTGGWVPTADDISVFLNTAISLNLTAANFFSWDECRSYLPTLWSTIQNYVWGADNPGADITLKYISALNSKDPLKVAALYNSNAVHITSRRTIQGNTNITTWNKDLMSRLLPNGTYTLIQNQVAGNVRHFTWTATSSAGSVTNGSDTIGITNGKISYHYSNFSING